MRMDSHQIIVRPLHTEKSVNDIRDSNTYHFEELFPDCRVVDVRTLSVRGKLRRVRRASGRTKAWKKAIVKLRPGDSIDIGY